MRLVADSHAIVWQSQRSPELSDVAADAHLTPAQVISGDIDFLGNAADVQLAADLLGGRARLTKWEDRTTLAGVAIFLDSDGQKRRLDFMQSPYGMNADDVRKTAVHMDLILRDGRQTPRPLIHAREATQRGLPAKRRGASEVWSDPVRELWI